MAYAAVISLRHTMERLAYSSPEIITPLYKKVHSLQQNLKRPRTSSSTLMDAIDAKIRDVVSRFEDVFESYVSDEVASQLQIFGDEVKLSLDLQNLKPEIDFFIAALKKMEEEYIKELEKPLLPDDEEEDNDDSSTADFGGEKSAIFGLSDVYNELRDQLTVIEQLLRFKAVALVGMAGFGKTTLARKFFEDPLILDYFECHAWVKVGRKCRLEKIIRHILAQLDSDRGEMCDMDEEMVAHSLRESLKGKRFLIVLDDVWETNLLVEIAKLCHYDKDGSRILLTSRLQHVGGRGVADLHMRLLNKEESWDLLREKVFGEESCSYQLEKVGRKVAENCEGLPLMIVKVAGFLSKYGEKTVECWSEVMSRKNHKVYTDAYKEICEVVFPSYDNLQWHLKACFLYMGVFRQNYEISQSKLIKMWIAEGFLEPYNIQDLEHHSKACLNELVSNNLVMFTQQSSISVLEQTKGVKNCKLHSCVWYLCNREAMENKFFHVLRYLADAQADGLERQRRLCVHNSVLLGIKDVHESMVENCGSTVRSLLCFGVYHQYQVTICSYLRLLRVLDALSIRMYEFPNDVLELVHLRYLALTCDGELPGSISKLWNLHILIIHRHLGIKWCEDPSYLPMEIWDMKGLKHLEIMGCDLPHPNGAFLCHLEALLRVSFDSLADGILEAIPNMKKLGVQILAPNTASCFSHVSHLHKLQTLKCVVVNPDLEFGCVQSPLPDFSKLPLSLVKLSLSGFGYEWECMGPIASLPNLQVLKLRSYAFQGPRWEVQENGFLKLQYLKIEDTDLEEWMMGKGSFPWLCCLSLKHCYNLQEIHWEFESGVFTKIELVDCNPLGVTCLQQLREARLRSKHYVPDIFVHSSWMLENQRVGRIFLSILHGCWKISGLPTVNI